MKSLSSLPALLARCLINTMSTNQAKKKFYVVVAGYKPGIYQSYPEVLAQTSNYPNALHKSFPSFKDAYLYFQTSDTSGYDTTREREREKVARYLSQGLKESRETANGSKGEAGSGLDGDRSGEGGGHLEFMNNDTDDASQYSLSFLNDISDHNSDSVFKVFEDVQPDVRRSSRKRKRITYRDDLSDYVLADFERLLLEEIERSVQLNTVQSSAPRKSAKKAREKKVKVDEEGNFFNHDGIPVVYTDGCCLNQASKTDRKAGSGVFWGMNDSRNIAERLWGDQTNQRAELWAVIRGVQSALQSGYEEVEVRTDSSYVINAMTKWIHTWKRNGFKSSACTRVKNVELFVLLDHLQAYVTIHWVKIKSHSKDLGNDRADTLAKYGAGLSSHLVLPLVKPSLAVIRDDSKGKAIEEETYDSQSNATTRNTEV